MKSKTDRKKLKLTKAPKKAKSETSEFSKKTLNSLADGDRDTRKERGKVGQVCSAQLYKVMKSGAQVTKTHPEVNVKAKNQATKSQEPDLKSTPELHTIQS